ncbi:helix-turn-helix domain-containing protein [Spongiimicrobium salis]|uniref:helix-turn-helix domain-containing protein n=1 Tax=Spongiimicrobium salis TaxID=1667022 RepID=UPI00374DC173
MTLFLDFSLITGILMTFLMLFSLVRKKEKSNAQQVLLTIFTLLFLALVCYYGYLHKIYVLLLSTYLFVDTFDVLIGPLLWVYVRCITNSPYNTLYKNKIHFIYPLISTLLISIPSMVFMVQGTFDESILGTLNPYFSFEILYSLGYTIAAYTKLLSFQKAVKHNYSNLENKDLNWIRIFLIGIMGIALIDISTSIYELTLAKELSWNIGYLTVLPGILLLIYLGYYGISQATILVPDFLLNQSHASKTSENQFAPTISKKYEYDAEEMKQLKLQLSALMEQQKPYLMEDLTLSHLAKMLSTSDKKLSTLLNQHMKISFYDYVNGFRVQAVKNRLKENWDSTYTLLGIAYDCGFKSKSSFNRIFKKNTGLSPSAYKKKE